MSLCIRDLVVHHGAMPILHGIAIDAKVGEVTALIGPNGAGKSTLLKAVLGLIPSTGRVEYDGADLRMMTATMRATRIAYVPQRSLLQAALPVHHVVATGRFAHRGWFSALGPLDRLAIDHALESVDALACADRAFTTLSAGEQQRVLIARALVSEAPCILMDEPTASLDVGHAIDVLRLARKVADSGKTMVVVLHQLDDAQRTADHLVLLHRGQVLASGTPDAVLSVAPLAEAFAVTPVPAGALGFRRLDRTV